MTIKRLILLLLTIFALTKVFFSLADSLQQPQVQSRLELYQTNLVLQASEIQFQDQDSSYISVFQDSLIGNNPYSIAKEQYEKISQVAENNLISSQKKQQELLSINSQNSQLATETIQIVEGDTVLLEQLTANIQETKKFLDELKLKIGILDTQTENIPSALTSWESLLTTAQKDSPAITKTADILIGLWSEPSLITEGNESYLKTNLDGWFRYQALKQLYQVQQRPEKILTLNLQQQEIAKQVLIKLTLIATIPILGGIVGFIIIIFLVIQWAFKGENSLLISNNNITWSTPWDWEVIWQVLIIGFFCVGQILLPLFIGLLGFDFSSLSLRWQATYILITYLLMSISVIGVLYISIKPFLPLSSEWFRFQWLSKWVIWGVGGYLTALPLVVIVSLLNQKIWQGHGGSNPLLSLVLQAEDPIVLIIFFVTASIAAPIFEEIIFRGFLLSSLTRYMSSWNAIALSGFLFAVAHLNVSEILPLATLGIILGFVYTSSRNLLSSILLHSLWNTGTLLSLFILGSNNP